ncbi:diphosphate--fructose-6-phosphate 1-phosphotransferase [Treponema phagedenis]|uniref:Pyrophosphate--fructose 6-phosphate 1-phosphotransferase n=1 Tax=Treponema phagedenis TaxID=162 RepID=A0AAE6M8S1_TREPH|nr:diphosphate--fructose-6-phosphate 1-phosphotransferase [Treponema phagedenis]NVP23627.1 diphosphate--fructose-6-phosphate 1-phosphotransferase [Treponema phagedenis]QEJ94538.1 diphosphate--fructose-6-phosphate 1-phosphotransferase [Treponema phagedenis]QEJ98759.1 diphosphate--fructose-6-phosphate 1-phosphotransferase [Treponema phagedenis]QEK01583.1 diphosphate--fructose-6-phosphate 1-phosphotransferase [Treponema phagedenis]QEK06669.1 diphosphate--fructose-6-phosphate 1-phosphotransferase 
MKLSVLQKARYEYQPKLPAALKQALDLISMKIGEATKSVADQEEVKALFPATYGRPLVTFRSGASSPNRNPLRVGVILSGGQAPGGHNVIAGLFDGLKKGNADSKLFGFLNGPAGLIDGKYKEIDAAFIDEYRNTGGFDIIGSGRTKIETDAQVASSLEVAKKMKLDAVVIIGGDDSNTNAALLAEHFIKADLKTQVIGVPKTIDGDLKNDMIETSFGFDTATKTYSELIGNIARDANSAKKYWHFIKLMGRSASHIALECALSTQPNVCLISEEIENEKKTLGQITQYLCDIIAKRAENEENFGIVLIPEGLIEFIPEMKTLISELNDAMAKHADEFTRLKTFAEEYAWVEKTLSKTSVQVFASLPEEISKQLLMDRDPHGNVQVSRIETEKLLLGLVQKELAARKNAGTYKGSFSGYTHFFGYEGRCAFPSNFDADYCYSLGFTAFLLIAQGLTGYLSSVRNLTAPADEWQAGGVPLTMMMNMEQRHGSKKPVIKKALVELDGKPFQEFAKNRDKWAITTSYLYPGAIQYYGPTEVCDAASKTLQLEQGKAKR